MSVTFYDLNGRPAAYSQDDTHIYLFSGVPVAYLSGASVYAYSGAHLGRFEDGWVRDNAGRCVFFTEQARGGPTRPIQAAAPIKAARQIRPAKSIRAARPLCLSKTFTWSGVSRVEFFRN